MGEIIITEEIEKIRNKLRNFIEYEEGRKLRLELHKFAVKYYKPNHTPSEYFKFMNENECSFKINGAQQTNFPYYFSLFTTKSQHVYGDCIEECLDKAME